jgi:hypothetical protein
MNNWRILFLTFCALSIAPVGFAQSLATLYVSGGYTTADLAPLNASVSTRPHLPDFSDDFLSLGWGIRIGGPNFRVGLHIQHLSQSEQAPANQPNAIDGKLSATQVILDVNWGLIKTRGKRLFVLAPTLGVGYERTRISYRTQTDATFDEVVDAPGRGVALQRYNVILDAALQLDLALKHDPEFEEAGRIITLRFGYLFNPFGFDWREQIGDLGGRKLDEGPDFSLAGPYVRLGIGI